MAEVLLFGFNSLPEILAAEGAAKAVGAEVRVVPPKDWGLPVGEIADGKSAPDTAAPPTVTGKMLVLCGLQGGRLDALLDALRKAGVTGHRAVLTPRNRSWTASRLLAELDKEQAAIQVGIRN